MMKDTIRSLWAWTATSALIIGWLPLLAVVRATDRDPARYRTGRWFRRLGGTLTRINPAWVIEVTGEHIANPRNPYVVISNHQSLVDIPILSRLPWEMKWIAKAEIFKLPVLGWMLRLAGDIPVERDSVASRGRALVHARDVLRKKCSVIFFPEGTRSHDGRVMAFSDGPFRLAIKEQVPILPVALDGSQDALPKHNWRFGQPSTVRVRVLPPVPTAGLTTKDVDGLRDQVRGMIMQQLATWQNRPLHEVDAGPDSGEAFATSQAPEFQPGENAGTDR
jgi:1-acyl-sn-glycerol-3-phosphate acyltransferase